MTLDSTSWNATPWRHTNYGMTPRYTEVHHPRQSDQGAAQPLDGLPGLLGRLGHPAAHFLGWELAVDAVGCQVVRAGGCCAEGCVQLAVKGLVSAELLETDPDPGSRDGVRAV